jgi:hypothetical protein
MLSDPELIHVLAREVDFWREEAAIQSRVAQALVVMFKVPLSKRRPLLGRLWYQFGTNKPSHGIPREDL